MGRYVFDIILITLAIVVIFHLFYNDILFTKPRETPRRECMDNVPLQPSQNTMRLPIETDYPKNNLSIVSSDSNESEALENIPLSGVKNDMDGKTRDFNTKGLDRTDPERKPWYHVANKLEGTKDDNSIKQTGRLVFEDNYDKHQTSDPRDNIENSVRDMPNFKKVIRIIVY